MFDVSNPYLSAAQAANFGDPDPDKVKEIMATGDLAALQTYLESLTALRDTLAARYAHAIPDEDVLTALVALGPLIEIGAGTGYWAKLLRDRGVDVLAYDVHPPTTAAHENFFHRNDAAVGTCWTTVLQGGPEQAGLYRDRTLFLCWPPPGAMAEQALGVYRGSHVALIYTPQEHILFATPVFFERLRATFALQAFIPLPRWSRIEDRLTIWCRRGGARRGR